MIKLKKLLIEELIGEFYGYEVYKNPKSITRMQPDMRAISFPNGDLFVVDENGRSFTHSIFSEWLNGNGYKIPFQMHLNTGIVDSTKKGYITWQRKGSSNEFWLGESVSFKNKKYFKKEELMPYIEKYTAKVRSKNPKYKYVLETIK